MLRGPEHVVAPEQVRRVYVTTTNRAGGVSTSAVQAYALYRIARDEPGVFDGAGAYTPTESRIGSGPDSYVIPTAYATADLFATLGVRPYFGRFFTADEDRPPRGEDVWKIEDGGDERSGDEPDLHRKRQPGDLAVGEPPRRGERGNGFPRARATRRLRLSSQ